MRFLWFDNSVLERDIRSIQEVTKAVHLQAGFAIRPGLWAHSAVFATFVLNVKHNLAAREETRYVAATGAEFLGRRLLLGQLVFYRVDPRQKEKFDRQRRLGCSVGIMARRWTRILQRCLSCVKLQEGEGRIAWFRHGVPVPFEELFVPDGEPVLPMQTAFNLALENFTEPKFPDIKGLEVPFSPIGPESTRAKRHEYITLDRLIKYGGTPGCKACKGEAVLHTPVCKTRFDGLIRADKAAEARSKSAPPTPATLPPTPGLLDPAPVASPPHSPHTSSS